MQQYYLGRKIDADLRGKVVQWLNSDERVGWIALVSEPGHGNTSLLLRLQEEIRTNENFSNSSCRPVLIQACERDPLRPPSEFPPLASELLDLVNVLESSFWSRLRRRFVDFDFRQLPKFLIVCLLLSLLCFAVVAVTETHSANPNLEIVSPQFGAQLLQYAPSHWPTILVLAVVFVLAFTLTTNFLLSKIPSLHRERFAKGRNAADERKYQTLENVYELLHRAAVGVDALVLFIDDLYGNQNPAAKTLNLRKFFKDLVADSNLKNDVAQFRDSHRVLLVSIECTDLRKSERAYVSPKADTRLDVPAFGLYEVAEIARNSPNLKQEPDAHTLDEATLNINRLFDGSSPDIEEEIREQINLAGEISGSDEIGFADVVALVAFSGRNTLNVEMTKRWFKNDPRSELWDILQPIGLTRADDRVFTRLAASSFVRWEPSTIYVDEPALSAFRRLTRDDRHLQLYGVRALYCWFQFALKNSQERAAWYALRLTELAQDEKQALSDLGLPGPAAQEFAHNIATVMLDEAESLLQSGDLASTTNFVWKTEDWLESVGQSDAKALKHRMWWILGELHFLSGDSFVGNELGKAQTGNDADLKEDPLLTVYARLESLFRGAPRHEQGRLVAVDWLPEKYRHHYEDLRLLDDSLWTARTRAGDWWTAFYLPELATNDPGAWYRPGVPRTIYRYFQLLSAILRKQPDEAKRIGLAWREEALLPALPQSGLLGEAFGEWHHAMFLLGALQIQEYYTPRKEALDLYSEVLGNGLHASDVSVVVTEARRRFANSRQIFILLRMERMLIHVCRTYGVLQWTFGDSSGENTRLWESLWSRCIELESVHHWHYYKPEIFYYRFLGIQQRDVSESLDDSYRFYEEALIAGYPTALVFAHSRNLRIRVVNYGREQRHFQMGVELYKTWGKQLLLPEARSFWSFPREAFERSSGFYWMSRFHRQLQDSDQAQKDFNQSIELVASEFPGGYDEACENKDVRSLIQLHQFSSFDEAEDEQGRRRALRLLWRTFDRSGFYAAQIIWYALRHDQLLSRVSDHLTAHADDPLIQAYLPEQTPAALGIDTPITLWELRFQQILGVLGTPPDPTDSIASELFNRDLDRYSLLNGMGVLLLSTLSTPNDLRPSYRIGMERLLRAELKLFTTLRPSLQNAAATAGELLFLSPDNEELRQQEATLKRELELMRMRAHPMGLNWLQKMDEWMDSMPEEQIDAPTLRERNEQCTRLLAEVRSRVLAGDYPAARDLVLQNTSEGVEFVSKEEVVLLNIGLHAAAKAEPVDREAYRVLNHRYWAAKERFIESLGVSPEQAGHLSLRMLDLFDEPVNLLSADVGQRISAKSAHAG